MAGGFVQTELRPTEMPNTVAAPIDTYAKPNPESNQAAAFLAGLGKLVGPATDALRTFDTEQGDAAEAEARMKALGAKPEDLRKEIESGNYFGMAHKRAQTALKVMDAQNRVFEVSAQLDAMHQRGELAGADRDGLIHGLIQQHTDALGNDPLVAKTFERGMLPVMRQYGAAILKQNIALDQDNKAAKLYEYTRGLHDQVDRDAKEQGITDPAQIAELHKKALFKTADFAKNDLLLASQQVEAVLGKAAQHYAMSGNVAAVEAIGRFDRNGAALSSKYGPQWDTWVKQAKAVNDGDAKKAVASSVDSLEARALRGDEKPVDFYKAVDEAKAKDPTNFGEARAQRLKAQFDHQVAVRTKQATDQLSTQQEQAAEREFVEQGARALTAGHGYMLPSEGRFTAADGKERLYTRKDYNERMYQRAEAVVEEQGKVAGWSPEQVAAAKVHLYGRNGDVHPVYKSSFDGLFASSRAGITAKPEQLQQRLGQLEFMRNTDPGQFANLADTRDTKQATWLAAYRAGRDFGMDPEHAYLMANQRVFNPTSFERLTPGAFNEKIDEVLKKFAGEGIVSGPLARAKAADAINIQLAAGVPEKDIATRATDTLKATHIIASGVAVHNSIPLANAATAKEYLEDAARFTKAGNPKMKAAPYSIALTDDPVKIGHYTVIRTDTMERLSLNSVSGAALKDYVLEQRRREKLANETIYERQERERRERGEDTASPMLRWFKEHQGLQSWDNTWKDGTGTQYYSTKPEGQ